MAKSKPAAKPKERKRPFRRAVWGGLAIVLPPLLTIVIFLWIFNTVHQNVLVPIRGGIRDAIVWYSADIHDEEPIAADSEDTTDDEKADDEKADDEKADDEKIGYSRTNDGKYVPKKVFNTVKQDPGPTGIMPGTADAVYRRYVEVEHLDWVIVVPLFGSVFLILLYLLGKFLAAGIGRFFWNAFERIIHQLPVIRNVYGSVKQVTDFFFSERDIEFNRVVAVEYPRKGMWSLGFVTGDGMRDICSAANEPVITVLMPTSPMPATGFTVTVKKSETVDLDITVDQALQFVVSCGVVLPAQQQYQVESRIRAALDSRELSSNGGPEAIADAAAQSDDSDE